MTTFFVQIRGVNSLMLTIIEQPMPRRGVAVLVRRWWRGKPITYRRPHETEWTSDGGRGDNGCAFGWGSRPSSSKLRGSTKSRGGCPGQRPGLETEDHAGGSH